MKLKQYLLLVPVAAAILFAYCTKEQSLPTPSQNTENGVASDRTKCFVTVTVSSGSAQVCGTNNSLIGCSVVNTEQLFGTANLAAGAGGTGVYGVETSSGATVNGYLVITNTNMAAITVVTVTTATGSITFSFSTPAQSRVVTISPTCVPS